MFGGDKSEKAYTLFSESVTLQLNNDLRLGRGIFYDQVRMYAFAVPDMRKSETSRIFSKAVDKIGQLCINAFDKYKMNSNQTYDFIAKLQSAFLPLLKSHYTKIANKYFPSKIPPEALQTDCGEIIEILIGEIRAGTMRQHFLPPAKRYTKQYVDVPAYHQKRFCTEFSESSAERVVALLEPGAADDITDDIVTVINVFTIIVAKEYQYRQIDEGMQENFNGLLEVLAGDLADGVGVPDFGGDNMLFNAFASMPEHLIKADLKFNYTNICKPQIYKLFTDLMDYSVGKNYPQLYSDKSFRQITNTKISSIVDKLTSRLIEMRMDASVTIIMKQICNKKQFLLYEQ
ncbi:MAG: hypothetical protein LBM93_09735 [Oscillospiraceae bacterium]|jgi:hypothetical protein|nr:hypothetical protein [Oscillospiraceae bacterium]